MIIRIVKITLQPNRRKDFISLFDLVSQDILGFNGCLHVEIMLDSENENVAFTYSHWKSADDLEKYRQSALFAGTWSKAKMLFAQKAEAWSLVSVNRTTEEQNLNT